MEGYCSCQWCATVLALPHAPRKVVLVLAAVVPASWTEWCGPLGPGPVPPVPQSGAVHLVLLPRSHYSAPGAARDGVDGGRSILCCRRSCYSQCAATTGTARAMLVVPTLSKPGGQPAVAAAIQCGPAGWS